MTIHTLKQRHVLSVEMNAEQLKISQTQNGDKDGYANGTHENFIQFKYIFL